MKDNKTKELSRYDLLRKDRKAAAVMVDVSVFADIVKSGVSPSTTITSEGLPDDALFVSADYLPQYQSVQFIYLHEDFDSVQEGAEIPKLLVTHTRHEK